MNSSINLNTRITNPRYRGFKQSSEHINEHKAFLKKMKQFQDEYNKSKEKDWKSEITYIAEWLPKHMNEIDKQYIEEFKKAGL